METTTKAEGKNLMICRSCGNSDNIVPILDLGNTPWCNNFITKDQIGKEQLYPLRLVLCNTCNMAQLDYTVPKEDMFSNHTYVSGTTKTLANHFYKLAEENIAQFNLQPNDLVVDIGGNDGTQLLQYKKLGCFTLVNVESAFNIAEISKKNGIHTINEFFDEGLVDVIIESFNKKAKIISAAGVFFHLEELHSVIRGIKKLLSTNGIFVVQFMCLTDMIKNLNFDAIYHEHLLYYTLSSLEGLLRPYDLEVMDAYWSPIHAGSVIAKFVHKNSLINIKTKRLEEELHREQDIMHSKPNKDGIYILHELRRSISISALERLQIFAKNIEDKKDNLKIFLKNLKDQGKILYGYGAPAKSTTLLNYFGIDNTLITKVVEVNDLKAGLYTPATHIPIVLESEDDLPDYYLLLAYNFADEILAKNKHVIEKGVKFIIPFPTIKIIE